MAYQYYCNFPPQPMHSQRTALFTNWLTPTKPIKREVKDTRVLRAAHMHFGLMWQGILFLILVA